TVSRTQMIGGAGRAFQAVPPSGLSHHCRPSASPAPPALPAPPAPPALPALYNRLRMSLSSVLFLFLAHLGVGIMATLVVVSRDAGVKFFRFNAGLAAIL